MRWFIRTTALLALAISPGAGLVAPAEASAGPAHTVGFNGHVSTRDYEDIGSDVVCEQDPVVRNIVSTDQPQGRLTWSHTCGGEARLRIRFNAVLQSNGNVNYQGSIKLDEKDGTPVGDDWDTICWWTWNFNVPTGQIAQVVLPSCDDHSSASATANITFINNI